MKIYIVDDNISLADTLAESLEIEAEANYGIELETISWKNPVDAIENYVIDKPDIILLDMLMKPMNGLKTTNALRKIDSNCKIFIITAHGEDKDLDRALKAGAKKIIHKPVTATEIFKEIYLELPGKDKEAIMEKTLLKNRPSLHTKFPDLGYVALHIIKKKLIPEISPEGFSLLLHIHNECLNSQDHVAYFSNQELKAFLGINPQYPDSRVKRVRATLIDAGLLNYVAGHRNKGSYITTIKN